jgi:diacylglycerol O-acyltransferase / wax synthase
MIAVTLPVGVPDPAERLRHIVAETSCRKQTADGGVAGIVAMPAMLARVGVRCARHTAAGHINLYVTNVPGPPCPLYLAGARVRDVVPLAPLVAGVRLSVTALSYDGVLSVALLADEALTDFPALTAGVRAGLDTYLGDDDREVPVGGSGQAGTGTPPPPQASDLLSGSRHQEV